MPKKEKVLICIGTMGRPTFNRCYKSVMVARKRLPVSSDYHIIKNESPQSAWLNKMRIAAMGWDWCFQVDEDMYLYENALEDLYNFASRKANTTNILSASSLLYDLFLERNIGSFKIWRSKSLVDLEFRDVLGSDRDIARRGDKLLRYSISRNIVLGDHDSAPNKEIAYNKYFKYIQKLKKFDKKREIESIIKFLNNKINKNPYDKISKAAHRGACDSFAIKNIYNNSNCKGL